MQPALVSIEDGWQIAYLLEPLENGWVTVFLPQAPTPMSGNVMYLPADRVRPLNITMVQAMAIVKHIGVGSAETLRGADLDFPRAHGLRFLRAGFQELHEEVVRPGQKRTQCLLPVDPL